MHYVIMLANILSKSHQFSDGDHGNILKLVPKVVHGTALRMITKYLPFWD